MRVIDLQQASVGIARGPISGLALWPHDSAPPRRLFLLLHGYNADCKYLLPLAQQWQLAFPDALFILPNAPLPSGEDPAFYAWFPLAEDRAESRRRGPPHAAAAIRAMLETAWDLCGLNAADTVVAGFSQGAMTALHACLNLPEPLHAIVSMAGLLVPPDPLNGRSVPGAPVCLIHGLEDDVIDWHASLEAHQHLMLHGVPASLHLLPGVGHDVTEYVGRIGQIFLEQCSVRV